MSDKEEQDLTDLKQEYLETLRDTIASLYVINTNIYNMKVFDAKSNCQRLADQLKAKFSKLAGAKDDKKDS